MLCCVMLYALEGYGAMYTQKIVNVTVGSYCTLDPWKDIKGTSYSDQFYNYSCAYTNAYTADITALSLNESKRTSTYYTNGMGTSTKGYYATYRIDALKVGIYTVECTVECWYQKAGYAPKITYQVVVSEKPKVTSISIPQTLILNADDSYTFSPVIYETGASTTLTWTSSNPSVVSVSDKTITAKSPGTSLITCTASNGVSAQCVVTVNPNYATHISLSHDEGEVEINKTIQLTANVLPANVTNGTVSWSSSDESVAIVSTSGLVVGASEGWATITASTTDGSNLSASCLIHVVPPTILATSLTFDSANMELVQGDNATLTPTLLPANVSTKALEWASSDESIATVDAEGAVTAIKIGNAVITATTTDGTALSASCNVRVKSKSVDEFENVVYFNDATVLKNSSTTLALQLKNSADITAVQFDLALPEGMTLAQNAAGTAYDITFEEERADATTHTLSSALQEDGTLRVLCYSTANELFLGNEGAVLYFPITVGELQSGAYDLILQNIVITDKEGGKTNIHAMGSVLNVVETTPGDANGDGEVDVADIVNIANYILGSAAEGFLAEAADYDSDGTVDVADIVNIANYILGGNTASANALTRAIPFATRAAVGGYSLEVLPFVLEAEESKTVTLDLYNPGVEFTAFQCDIYLPEGLTIDKNRRGTAYNFTFNTDTERTDATYHTLSSALQEDGSVRVLCYSTASEIFLGEDGALLNIPVTADASLESGVYEFSIANTVLTYVNGVKVKPETYAGSIVVGNGGEVKEVKLHGRYTAGVLTDFSASLADNAGVTSIDLTDAVAVDATRSLTTGNPNTLICLKEGDALSNTNNVVCGEECSNLVLTDGYDFHAPAQFMAAQASHTRELVAGKYGTIVLPFVPDAATLSNYTFYELSEMGADAVTFAETDVVEAGTPYLYSLKPGATAGAAITGGETVITAELSPVTVGNCQMAGSYACETIDCASSLESYYAYSSAGNVMNHVTVQLAVKPFRAYIKKAFGAATSRMKIYIQDPKGIHPISADQIEGWQDDAIYDLSGRQVAMPVKGQIYIINGEKKKY